MATTLSPYQQVNGATRLPDLIDRLFNESVVLPSMLDRSYGRANRTSWPVNVLETSDGYLMQVALPGVNPGDVDIQVTGRDVAIRGRFSIPTPENSTWLWQSIPTGEFYESYTLPVDISRDGVQASYEHGILSLTLPKAEHLRPKTIKVEVSR